MTVAPTHRHKRGNECPICGGHPGLRSGKGVRCWGFINERGRYAYCTRDELAGSAPYDSKAAAYRHYLGGQCRCGVTHDAGPIPIQDGGFYRTVSHIEGDLKALLTRSEAAQSGAQYEADRAEYDALWRELEVAKSSEETPDNPHPGIEWVGLKKMFAPLPPIDWISEYLKLAAGPCACFAGYGYSGKTAIIQYLLLCLAFGKPLFGIYGLPRLEVGWMDYEQGFFQSASRLQRQARGLGIGPEELEASDRTLRYAEYPSVYLTDRDTKATDKIARAVEGIRICLLDSARAITPGLDENDSKIRIPFDALSRVTKQTGCQFIVVHHYGKGDAKNPKPLKERMRGSSALFDAMATVWGLERRERETFTRVELAKDRWTNQENTAFGVRFEDGTALDGKEWVKLHHLDAEQMKPQTKAALFKSQTIETIKANPQLTSVEAVRFHQPEGFRNLNETRSALRELEAAHQIQCVGGVYRAV